MTESSQQGFNLDNTLNKVKDKTTYDNNWENVFNNHYMNTPELDSKFIIFKDKNQRRNDPDNNKKQDAKREATKIVKAYNGEFTRNKVLAQYEDGWAKYQEFVIDPSKIPDSSSKEEDKPYKLADEKNALKLFKLIYESAYIDEPDLLPFEKHLFTNPSEVNRTALILVPANKGFNDVDRILNFDKLTSFTLSDKTEVKLKDQVIFELSDGLNIDDVDFKIGDLVEVDGQSGGGRRGNLIKEIQELKKSRDNSTNQNDKDHIQKEIDAKTQELESLEKSHKAKKEAKNSNIGATAESTPAPEQTQEIISTTPVPAPAPAPVPIVESTTPVPAPAPEEIISTTQPTGPTPGFLPESLQNLVTSSVEPETTALQTSIQGDDLQKNIDELKTELADTKTKLDEETAKTTTLTNSSAQERAINLDTINNLNKRISDLDTQIKKYENTQKDVETQQAELKAKAEAQAKQQEALKNKFKIQAKEKEEIIKQQKELQSYSTQKVGRVLAIDNHDPTKLRVKIEYGNKQIAWVDASKVKSKKLPEIDTTTTDSSTITNPPSSSTVPSTVTTSNAPPSSSTITNPPSTITTSNAPPSSSTVTTSNAPTTESGDMNSFNAFRVKGRYKNDETEKPLMVNAIIAQVKKLIDYSSPVHQFTPIIGENTIEKKINDLLTKKFKNNKLFLVYFPLPSPSDLTNTKDKIYFKTNPKIVDQIAQNKQSLTFDIQHGKDPNGNIGFKIVKGGALRSYFSFEFIIAEADELLTYLKQDENTSYVLVDRQNKFTDTLVTESDKTGEMEYKGTTDPIFFRDVARYVNEKVTNKTVTADNISSQFQPKTQEIIDFMTKNGLSQFLLKYPQETLYKDTDLEVYAFGQSNKLPEDIIVPISHKEDKKLYKFELVITDPKNKKVIEPSNIITEEDKKALAAQEQADKKALAEQEKVAKQKEKDENERKRVQEMIINLKANGIDKVIDLHLPIQLNQYNSESYILKKVTEDDKLMVIPVDEASNNQIEIDPAKYRSIRVRDSLKDIDIKDGMVVTKKTLIIGPEIPYIVKERVATGVYDLKDLETNEIRRTFSDYIKPIVDESPIAKDTLVRLISPRKGFTSKYGKIYIVKNVDNNGLHNIESLNDRGKTGFTVARNEIVILEQPVSTIKVNDIVKCNDGSVSDKVRGKKYIVKTINPNGTFNVLDANTKNAEFLFATSQCKLDTAFKSKTDRQTLNSGILPETIDDFNTTIKKTYTLIRSLAESQKEQTGGAKQSSVGDIINPTLPPPPAPLEVYQSMSEQWEEDTRAQKLVDKLVKNLKQKLKDNNELYLEIQQNFNTNNSPLTLDKYIQELENYINIPVKLDAGIQQVFADTENCIIGIYEYEEPSYSLIESFYPEKIDDSTKVVLLSKFNDSQFSLIGLRIIYDVKYQVSTNEVQGFAESQSQIKERNAFLLNTEIPKEINTSSFRVKEIENDGYSFYRAIDDVLKPELTDYDNINQKIAELLIEKLNNKDPYYVQIEKEFNKLYDTGDQTITENDTQEVHMNYRKYLNKLSEKQNKIKTYLGISPPKVNPVYDNGISQILADENNTAIATYIKENNRYVQTSLIYPTKDINDETKIIFLLYSGNNKYDLLRLNRYEQQTLQEAHDYFKNENYEVTKFSVDDKIVLKQVPKSKVYTVREVLSDNKYKVKDVKDVETTIDNSNNQYKLAKNNAETNLDEHNKKYPPFAVGEKITCNNDEFEVIQDESTIPGSKIKNPNLFYSVKYSITPLKKTTVKRKDCKISTSPSPVISSTSTTPPAPVISSTSTTPPAPVSTTTTVPVPAPAPVTPPVQSPNSNAAPAPVTPVQLNCDKYTQEQTDLMNEPALENIFPGEIERKNVDTITVKDNGYCFYIAINRALNNYETNDPTTLDQYHTQIEEIVNGITTKINEGNEKYKCFKDTFTKKVPLVDYQGTRIPMTFEEYLSKLPGKINKDTIEESVYPYPDLGVAQYLADSRNIAIATYFNEGNNTRDGNFFKADIIVPENGIRNDTKLIFIESVNNNHFDLLKIKGSDAIALTMTQVETAWKNIPSLQATPVPITPATNTVIPNPISPSTPLPALNVLGRRRKSNVLISTQPVQPVDSTTFQQTNPMLNKASSNIPPPPTLEPPKTIPSKIFDFSENSAVANVKNFIIAYIDKIIPEEQNHLKTTGNTTSIIDNIKDGMPKINNLTSKYYELEFPTKFQNIGSRKHYSYDGSKSKIVIRLERNLTTQPFTVLKQNQNFSKKTPVTTGIQEYIFEFGLQQKNSMSPTGNEIKGSKVIAVSSIKNDTRLSNIKAQGGRRTYRNSRYSLRKTRRNMMYGGKISEEEKKNFKDKYLPETVRKLNGKDITSDLIKIIEQPNIAEKDIIPENIQNLEIVKSDDIDMQDVKNALQFMPSSLRNLLINRIYNLRLSYQTNQRALEELPEISIERASELLKTVSVRMYPLEYAIMVGSQKLIEYLLESGADPMLKGDHGKEWVALARLRKRGNQDGDPVPKAVRDIITKKNDILMNFKRDVQSSKSQTTGTLSKEALAAIEKTISYRLRARNEKDPKSIEEIKYQDIIELGKADGIAGTFNEEYTIKPVDKKIEQKHNENVVKYYNYAYNLEDAKRKATEDAKLKLIKPDENIADYAKDRVILIKNLETKIPTDKTKESGEIEYQPEQDKLNEKVTEKYENTYRINSATDYNFGFQDGVRLRPERPAYAIGDFSVNEMVSLATGEAVQIDPKRKLVYNLGYQDGINSLFGENDGNLGMINRAITRAATIDGKQKKQYATKITINVTDLRPEHENPTIPVTIDFLNFNKAYGDGYNFDGHNINKETVRIKRDKINELVKFYDKVYTSIANPEFKDVQEDALDANIELTKESEAAKAVYKKAGRRITKRNNRKMLKK